MDALEVARAAMANDSEVHTEARGILSRTKANYCPFGCHIHDLDEYGYCYHLMGFTNDKKTYEAVNQLYRENADGESFNTGFKTVGGTPKPCESDDVFVNPERIQEHEGVKHMAKYWVSDRVYRKIPKPEALPGPPVKDAQRHGLKNRLKQLQKLAEEKAMREEIARLEHDLGLEPSDAELDELTAPAKP